MLKNKPIKRKVKARAEPVKKKYVFRLFVSGILPNSVRAITNINSISEKYLKGRFDLKIIDVYQQPSLAVNEEIVALPLLIKKSPGPEIRLIGDLSETEIVLKELGIEINME